jgi:Zinc-finger associated domain (zf-AD)
MDISCVVCLFEKDPMVNLSNKVNETSLQQMLAAHSQIVSPVSNFLSNVKISNFVISFKYQTDDHDSTKLLCQECTKELLIVMHFYDKCRKAEQFLKEQIKQDSVNQALATDLKLEINESEADMIIHEVDSGEIIQNFDDIIECDPSPSEVVFDEAFKSTLYGCSDCGKVVPWTSTYV